MKVSIAALCFLLLTVGTGCASPKNISSATNSSNTEQEIINLSREKWQWMADKNVDKLASLFHDQSKFVHMSGTWKKCRTSVKSGLLG
jgi:hypothetical protein